MGAFVWLAAIGFGIFAQQVKGRNGWSRGCGTMFICSIGNIYIDAAGGSSLYWECFVFGAAALVLLSQPSKKLPVESGADLTVRCPFCAEDVKVQAIVCKHCGSDIPAV